jgi:hypothetical protein
VAVAAAACHRAANDLGADPEGDQFSGHLSGGCGGAWAVRSASRQARNVTGFRLTTTKDTGWGGDRFLRLSWTRYRAWSRRKKSPMSNHTVVLAIFNDEASADGAAALLKESQLAKGDAIGVLALNEKGDLKADKVGKRSWGKGAGIGAVVALVTPVGLAAGLIGGGLLGALHHKNLGLSDADRERLRGALEGGKAAVGVLAPVGEAHVVADFLREQGGTPESHPVSDEAVEEAQTAATAEQS